MLANSTAQGYHQLMSAAARAFFRRLQFFALMLLLGSCSGAEVDFARSLAVPQPADVVLRNGKVLTLDRNFSIKEAVAIKDGRFLAVGSDREMRLFAGPRTRIIDLGGRTVIPGLIDAQIYATEAGLNWEREIHWHDLRTLADGLKMIAKAAQSRPAGSWIIVAGGWTPAQFAEGRFPTLAELDAIAPDHPVYLQHLTEDALLNSAALRTVGITGKTVEPKGGRFERTAGGDLTGWLRGMPAWRFAYAKIPKLSLERARHSLRACFGELNRFGVTSIGDLHGEDVSFAERRILADMARAGELTVRIHFSMELDSAIDEPRPLHSAAAEVKQLPQSDWFRFGGFAVDMSRADSMTDPAASLSPGAKESFRQTLRFFSEAGYPFRLRTQHDSITNLALDEIERVNAVPLPRQRVAFTDFEGASAATIERIKKIGAGVIVQSRAMSEEDSPALRAMGKSSEAATLRGIFEGGVTLGIGSNGFRANYFSPMLTLWWLVTGKTVAGTTRRAPSGNLSREQALRMYTAGGAALTAESHRKGSIEIDKFADLVVLNADYLTVPDDQIRSLESMLTMVGGRVVYFTKPFGPIETAHTDGASPWQTN